MPYSSTTTFYLTRDQIITRAAGKIGFLDTGESLNATDVTDFAQQLNAIIKETMAQGVGLWLVTEPTLFLQPGQAQYNLGPTGDHWTASYTATTLSAAANAAATSISVASATGITSTYNIGVTLTSGTIFWTTVNGAPSGTTVTLTTGLSGAASSGANVYVYQTAADRPQRVLYINRRYTADLTNIIDTPVTIFAKMDYWNTPQKQLQSIPTMAAYTPALTNGLLEIWPTYDGTSGYDQLKMVCETIITDLNAASDNPYYPTEWCNFLIWRLAAEMCHEFDVTYEKQQMLWQIADMKLQTLLSYDTSEAPIQFGLLKTGERY